MQLAQGAGAPAVFGQKRERPRVPSRAIDPINELDLQTPGAPKGFDVGRTVREREKRMGVKRVEGLLLILRRQYWLKTSGHYGGLIDDLDLGVPGALDGPGGCEHHSVSTTMTVSKAKAVRRILATCYKFVGGWTLWK
jgi:hypothetical protein